MSEPSGNGGPPAQKPILPPVQVVITFDPNTGDVGLEGPPNRMQLYGMLGMAFELAMQTALQQPASGGRILVPQRGPRRIV